MMKYTKRSLVGLFTLLIMQSGVAQATNNNAPYPFGEEFVYHTCPSGFDKQGMSCLKPASLKCDAGYSMGSNKQNCTKTMTKNVTRVCPSGYSEHQKSNSPYPWSSKDCIKTIEEVDYKANSSYWSESLKETPHFKFMVATVAWKGQVLFREHQLILGWGLYKDGWNYRKGDAVGRGRPSKVERWKIVGKNKTSVCPSGYTKSGSSCKKTVTKPVIKHCPSGSLNSNSCVVSPLRHSPIEETMAALYPRYSNDTEQQQSAAFRYLDNMFTLDPELGDIVSTMSSEQQSQDFSKLWANTEKSTADNALEVVEGFAALQPDLSYLKEILFDIYYDRAAAEFILANRSIDQARIDWINDADVSVASLELSRQNAVDILQRSLNEYWSLIDNHPQAYVTQLPQRDLQSARYLNGQGQHSPIFEGEALVVGYKDALLVYQMMNTLLEQQVHLSKLKAVYANTDTMQALAAEAQTLLNGVTSKATQLEQLLGSDAQVNAMMVTEQAKLNSLAIKLGSVIQWLKGEGNYLGLPDDFVLFLQGFKDKGNTVYDSFDAIKTLLKSSAYDVVPSAEKALQEAKNANTNYRYQRDQFRQTFANEQQALNNQLFKLLGCTVGQGDNLCASQTEAQRKGSLIAQQQQSIKAATLGVERAQKARQTIEGNITIEMERLEQEKQVHDAIDKIMVQFGQNELSLSQLLEAKRDAERNGSSSGKVTVDISELLKQEDLDTLDNFVTETGNVDLSLVQAALASLKEDLKDVPRDDAIKYTQTLAVLERATIRGLERGLLDVNSKARIKALMLELKAAEVDIAKSLSYLAYEVERLAGFSAEAERLIAQLGENQQQQADRYYANPVHYSVLTKEALNAELAFAELQEWMFYAVQALEYKWQEAFVAPGKGFNRASVFKIQTIPQLVEYFKALQRFDDIRNLRTSQEATDTLSVKKHVFGYVDKLRGKTMWYPALDGSGDMLTADEAFKAKLTQLTQRIGQDQWLTVEFSTVKELPRSNFFQGPVVAGNDDLTCLADAGTYLDKLDGIGINLQVSMDISGEDSTPAYLTYGGNNYMRSRTPGSLTDDETGIKDELVSYSTRFWDVSNGNFFAKDSYRQQMSANIMTDEGSQSAFLNPTYAFKERSVAASGWRLSVKLSDEYGDIVDLDGLDDIELIIKHRYYSRNAETCGGGGTGPLILLR